MKFTSINQELPPENTVVDTALMDIDVTLTGPKKKEDLKYVDGKWVRPDGSEIDYTPTDWRFKE